MRRTAVGSYTGDYILVNPVKHRTHKRSIKFKSMMEQKFMRRCDLDENIIQWDYEGMRMQVPYSCPVRGGSRHTYIIDFWVKYKSADGSVREAFVEIKPYKQTVKPSMLGKGWKARVKTYLVNAAKWKYAKAYAERMGKEFWVITEKYLNRPL